MTAPGYINRAALANLLSVIGHVSGSGSTDEERAAFLHVAGQVRDRNNYRCDSPECRECRAIREQS